MIIKIYLFLLFSFNRCWWFAGICAYEPCAGGTQQNQKRVLDHLELQPQMVISSRVADGT